MGLPILGKISNIYSITQDMVVEYHKRNYFGENIIIIGAGDHKHEDLVEMVSTHFSNLPRKSPLPAPPGLDSMRRPKFCDEFSLIQYE